jgi:hypothetical protein
MAKRSIVRNPIITETAQLRELRLRLEGAEKFTPFTENGWYNDIPKRPGVYAIWSLRNPETAVYVGESSNLQERLEQLGKIDNHTFAGQIAARRGFTSDTDVKRAIKRHYVVSYIRIAFGRAELEEYLVTHWRTYRAPRFNSRIDRRWRCD